ncbi:MAG: HesA/MoeB/ThiF family protein [Oscillospiraceae bacterium]|nr:HesA/MoeB/ThiF family protein [Oscillospiraceae bacterium]
MKERYIRNIGAITEAEAELLRKSTVFVAGCGGLGGHIIDQLLRIGVGSIRAADGDVFEESNLNRQLLSAEPLMGVSKAKAAMLHARQVNSDVSFTAYPEYITGDNAEALIAGCDIVIDALDSIAARKLLKAGCDRQGIPFVHGAVSDWRAQAALTLPGDGFLDKLYPMDDTPGRKCVLAFTPAVCAALQTSLCVKYLCGREVEAGRLIYLDLDDMELFSFL